MYMVFLYYFAWISSLPYIIIVLFPFSHWKQGVVELTAFSSPLASWFVVRQIAVPPVGLSAWRSFVFRSSISMIIRPDFTVIHTSLECTSYLYIIVFYALIIYLTYHCSIRFLFSLRAGGLRSKLAAFSSLTVPWVVITPTCGAVGGGGVVGLMISCFRCSISMISAQFHCDTSLQCACCVVKLLYYARIISLQYHYRIIFLFSLKAEGRRFDGFVNAGGSVSCQYDKLRCHRWRRGISAWWPLVSVLV